MMETTEVLDNKFFAADFFSGIFLFCLPKSRPVAPIWEASLQTSEVLDHYRFFCKIEFHSSSSNLCYLSH